MKHLFYCLLIGVAFNCAATPNEDTSNASIQGEWEVTAVLMTGGMQPQWSMHENDPRMMGRRLRVTPDAVEFKQEAYECGLIPMITGKPQPMKALFAMGLVGTRPKSFSGPLYGSMDDYDLGPARGQPVKLFELQCKKPDENFLAESNWIALTSATPKSPATLLMAYQPDALLVLQRPAANIGPLETSQATYCREASTVSDKAICADRQLLTMHGYTQSALKRAHSPRPEVNAALERDVSAQRQKRLDCQGDVRCIYQVLDEHIAMLVQRW